MDYIDYISAVLLFHANVLQRDLRAIRLYMSWDGISRGMFMGLSVQALDPIYAEVCGYRDCEKVWQAQVTGVCQ